MKHPLVDIKEAAKASLQSLEKLRLSTFAQIISAQFKTLGGLLNLANAI